MNKNIVKTVIAGLTCVALCGTTLAAPMRGNGGRTPAKAPTRQQTPAPARHHEPATHREPAPAPERHRTPAPREHHREGHHAEKGWITLGAAVLGGVVGGIVGACR